MMIEQVSFEVNGRAYRPPSRPVVVICIDGCADEYLSVSIAKGFMPRTAELIAHGYRGMVRGALPSFTNVNNTAIVTGMPPAVTGICGNFFSIRKRARSPRCAPSPIPLSSSCRTKWGVGWLPMA